MAILNFSLVTEVQPLLRRDFPVSNTGLLNPNNETGSASSPKFLLDGEFVGLNSSYQAAREGAATATSGGSGAGNPSASGSVSEMPWWVFWMERGRTDMRAIDKLTVLFGGAYEADFGEDVLNTSSDTFAVGDKLFVNWLSNGSDINRRRGLTKVRNSTDGLCHGYVTRVFASGSTFVMRAFINIG